MKNQSRSRNQSHTHRNHKYVYDGYKLVELYDNDTLLEAQRHPENYRDLVVRVAGYSAFFVELCKDVQDEIISRTVLRSI